MIDYSNIQTASAEPEPSAMIETLRSIGYSLPSAVADIIDNSISAEAGNIWITRDWSGGKSVITIKDDGRGMTGEEIKKALRPGSQNPNEIRSLRDLGRFGLGLKTASFSQCLRVTVLSKKKGESADYWSWDLEYVAQFHSWKLIKWIPDGFENSLDGLESGTIIIWSALDRILRLDTPSTDVKAHEKFSHDLDRVHQHIAMTFHRFIEDRDIKIWWCGKEVQPWNPFCIDEKKTQPQPEDSIAGGITIKGFILPHPKNFSSEQACKVAEGMNGWTSHQGFYVYRGKRLILAGSWLGLFKKEEPYKLVRIMIDLPNTQDSLWKIDIKKSQAYPPAGCREQLMAYAKDLRGKGWEVYRHKGKIIKQRAKEEWQPLWLDKKKDDKWSFVINRDNTVIKGLREMAKTQPDRAIETLLKLIEDTIPTASIYAVEASSEEHVKEPYTGCTADELRPIASIIYGNLRSAGLTPEQAKGRLLMQEPFNFFEELIDSL